jgi:type IV pilus assembly protein PilW
MFKHPTARSHSRKRSLGLTLVELLVALAISAVVAVAAVAALTISRQGFTTVDAASQLRDNARFAADLIQRLGVQTGHSNTDFAAVDRSDADQINPPPSVFGFNNAKYGTSPQLYSPTTRTDSNEAGFGSDILIFGFQTSAPYLGATSSDGSMINCFGAAPSELPVDRDDRFYNILSIGISSGEPALMCRTGINISTGATSSTSTVTLTATVTQPLVTGVENFQVLYGVDGVFANQQVTSTPTGVATNYLRADQLVVPGDTDRSQTNANWRRVRSIRIGMVIRGPIGSAQETLAQTYYPFGRAADSSGGAAGSALSSASDPGTVFTPAADSRLRQVVTFTIHLRNEQGL